MKPSPLRFIRYAAWGLLLLVIVAAGWIMVDGGPLGRDADALASFGGPFTLTDTDDHTVTEARFAGRAHAFFFGYTHCPDICPTTLAALSEYADVLGADAQKLDLVFITVDPARDTPASLKTYLASFPAKFIGLSGTEAETARIIKAYNIYARKVPGRTDDDYTVDHTAAVFLFDASGKFRGTISDADTADAAVAKLRRLIRG